MIKVVLFCLVWIACAIVSGDIWRRNVTTKYCDKHGRDEEFVEYESVCNALGGMEDLAKEAKSGDIRFKASFALGVIIATIVCIGFWPILTPMMLWVGNRYPDETMTWLGYVNE